MLDAIFHWQPLHPEWMVAPMNGSAWSEWMTSLMGGVSRQTSAAAFPPDRFYCLLDELPLHLICRSVRRSWQDHAADSLLHLNPACVVAAGDHVPDEFQGRMELLSGFALQGTIAWVRGEVSGVPLPFWLGPEFESLLSAISPGETIPYTFPTAARQLLMQAGILISEDSLARLRTSRDEAIRAAGTSFRQKGYAPIADLIHPFHVAALRRYYRYLIRTGEITLGDYQSPRRFVAHNEPVARFFHHQIAATLSAIAGEPLKPSYVYLASYLSGAELKKHTDREQCEFSITLCLDFSPEPELATPWPIQLDAPSGTATIFQGIGDGLAYRGTKVPHYRTALGAGQSSTSIFFHYVAKDFSGTLD